MHDGHTASREFKRRNGFEAELMRIYAELEHLDRNSKTLNKADYNDFVFVARPLSLLLYSIIFWALGIFAVFVLREYIHQTDALLRFSSRPIY